MARQAPAALVQWRVLTADTARTVVAGLFVFAALGGGGCGREEVSGSAAPPKPVTVMDLRPGVPRTETLVAGVVEPYRRSDTSFDVSGLVLDVIDLGEPAEGPQYDGEGSLLLTDSGVPVREGTVLAMLDPTRFQQAVSAAELSLASTDRQIDALRLELERVYPARLDNARASASAASAEVTSSGETVRSAEAELELARVTVERDRVLIQSGAIAQSVLDQSESAFRTAAAGLARARASLDAAKQSEQSAVASLAESEGSLLVRQADLESLRASRAELLIDLERAQTDLVSSVLRAPFQGRVTARYIERGAFANAGTPIVELTMETAVKVVITVSAEEEREIALGMSMPIYSGSSAQSEESSGATFTGTVFEKASVADSGTRTFRIGLILPNPLREPPTTSATSASASVGDLFPVMSMPGLRQDDLYVNVACTFERDGQTFVLALPDSLVVSEMRGSVQTPRAIPVALTDDWQQFDTWSLRRIEPTPDLSNGDTLILNPDESDEAGVVLGSPQYVFRPGDVVRVGLDAALPRTGFWIPATAIVPRTGDSLVFAVEQGSARAVVVDVLESSGSFRRIIADGLDDGAAIVVRGMQYLSDGDPVTSEPAAVGGGR